MIPKIIHQVWEGQNDAMPPAFKELSETVRANHPDYRYMLWDYGMIDKFIREHFSWQLVKNYYKLTYNIQRWDVIRYMLLDKVGGIYLDLDVKCHQSFSGLLERLAGEGKRSFIGYDSLRLSPDRLAPAMMGSEPGNKLLWRAYTSILETNFYRYNIVSKGWRTSDTLTSTGPYAITSLYNDYESKSEVAVLDETILENVLATHNFEEAYRELKPQTDTAIVTHLFSNSWIQDSEALTIVIPFLNEGENVWRTVASIRATESKHSHIILINDGSNDGYDYGKVAELFDCALVVHEDRHGVAACRDEGVSMAATKCVMLLDAHCEFYKNNWDDQILLVLSENFKCILGFQTSILWESYDNKAKDHSNTFGARLAVDGDHIMQVTWSYKDPDPGSNLVEIACVLGGAYAINRDYYMRLHGLQGLHRYGLDEELLSLKVHASGGKCLLLKDVVIGHVYRSHAPYTLDNESIVHNLILVLSLFLEGKTLQKMLDRLHDKYGSIYDKVFAGVNFDFIASEKAYLKTICSEPLDSIFLKSLSST
jgi:glycosyltransferase involved in cell wall biosynthesis